jgi:hypothetical protein
MYFCPKCDYLFDITKATNQDIKDNRIVIKKVADVFKKVENNEDLTKYRAEFSFEDLNKNLKYKKLSDIDKQNINKLFEEVNLTNAEFKCNSCNFIENIDKTTLLYKYEVEHTILNTKTLEENELLCSNPILPRTHDYICKNILCDTNKGNTKTKEAVFYRDNNTFKVNYICCICYYSW